MTFRFRTYLMKVAVRKSNGPVMYKCQCIKVSVSIDAKWRPRRKALNGRAGSSRNVKFHERNDFVEPNRPCRFS